MNATQKMRAEREKAVREKKIRTWVTLGIIGVALVIGIALVAGAVLRTGSPDNGSSRTVQGGAVDGYTLVVGKADAPVTVDVYQDYLCPYCGQFERANRADLESLVDAGAIRLRLHPMNFLDAQSAGSRYSTRAANAAVTVAQHQPEALLAFNAALYDHQPAEGTGGLTDDQIADIARGAGVEEAVFERFAAGDNTSFVQGANQAAFDAGVQSTPTVRIDGQEFEGNLYAAGEFKAAVEAAAQGS